MTFRASSRVYAPVSVPHRQLAIRRGKTSPLTSIIHHTGKRERQHGPIVLSHVSEDFNGSQSHIPPFFFFPRPRISALTCCHFLHRRTKDEDELAHFPISVPGARPPLIQATGRPRRAVGMQCVTSSNARAPHTHTHDTHSCMRLSCWPLAAEARLIRLHCLLLGSSWARTSC